jgi:AcrR family transcriptional regulator
VAIDSNRGEQVSVTTGQTARGSRRRQQILESAVELMAERGYSAVSLADIGGAAGIVGSGVYRHFESKSAILSALLDRAMKRMLTATHDMVASDLEGLELLGAMIRRQAEIVVADRHLIAVYLKDSGNVEKSDLRELRRQQRKLIEEWLYQCELIAPTKSEPEIRATVHGVLALINSIADHVSPMRNDRMVDAVSVMAIAALHAGLGLDPPTG